MCDSVKNWLLITNIAIGFFQAGLIGFLVRMLQESKELLKK